MEIKQISETEWMINGEVFAKSNPNQVENQIQNEKTNSVWGGCFKGEGYYIDENSEIDDAYTLTSSDSNRNVFRTEKQAKSALAMAQLSHIMAEANGDWKPDWNDTDNKLCICMYENHIIIEIYQNTYFFLNFKDIETARKVLEQNKKLINEYFEIDQ